LTSQRRALAYALLVPSLSLWDSSLVERQAMSNA